FGNSLQLLVSVSTGGSVANLASGAFAAYPCLIIRAYTPGFGATDALGLQFNSDTAANYASATLANGSNAGHTGTLGTLVFGAGATLPMLFWMQIYNLTAQEKCYTAQAY